MTTGVACVPDDWVTEVVFVDCLAPLVVDSLSSPEPELDFVGLAEAVSEVDDVDDVESPLLPVDPGSLDEDGGESEGELLVEVVGEASVEDDVSLEEEESAEDEESKDVPLFLVVEALSTEDASVLEDEESVLEEESVSLVESPVEVEEESVSEEESPIELPSDVVELPDELEDESVSEVADVASVLFPSKEGQLLSSCGPWLGKKFV